MADFRDSAKVKKRLLAYYRRSYGKETFPIDTKDFVLTERLKKELHLLEKEFIISSYNACNVLLLSTSQRLFILNQNEQKIKEFLYTDIVGIYLSPDFKNSEKVLNFITSKENYSIDFCDLKELVAARNELFMIINTVIENWEGNSFKVTLPIQYQENQLELFRLFYNHKGNNIEEALFQLKILGTTQGQCVKLLVDELGFSLTEADRVVLNSKTWQADKEATEKFRDELGGF